LSPHWFEGFLVLDALLVEIYLDAGSEFFFPLSGGLWSFTSEVFLAEAGQGGSNGFRLDFFPLGPGPFFL